MLRLELLPLLNVQRDLHAVPRGPARFGVYLEAMQQGTDDIVLPLAQMNPMGKEHVATLIDHLIALNAEGIVTDTLSELRERLPELEAELSVGLVMVDDAAGGWTNSYLTDATERFKNVYDLKQNWSLVFVWTSQTWDRGKVRRVVLGTVYRSLYKKRHGLPETLGQMMRQEGLAARFAGEVVGLDDEELEYSRDIITPYESALDYPVAFACLYGDEGAIAAGYPALGLPPKAGFEVGLSEALLDAKTPEQYLLSKNTG